MNKIIGHQIKCKQCNKIYDTGKTPVFPNKPTICTACNGDIIVEPIFEEYNKGLTYELSIFCKETGETIMDGCSIPNTELNNLTLKQTEDLVQLRISESFLRMIGANKDGKDQNQIKRLIRRQ